jgi:hypothetical protein
VPRRYLIVIKFAETEKSTPERMNQHVPTMMNTLKALSEPPSEPQIAFTSPDGSVLGIVVKTRSRTGDLLNEIQSHESGSEPPTRFRDQIIVLEIGAGPLSVQNAPSLATWLARYP